MIEPRSGLSRPTRVLRKTDLPVPEGPSMTEISPAGRVRETSCQMTCRPKDLVSPSTVISTPTGHTSPFGRPANSEGSTSARVSGYAESAPRSPPRNLSARTCDRGGTTGLPAAPPLWDVLWWCCLLDGHRGAGALEGCLGLVGGLLGHLFQDRLRGAVHQVLGLLETEAGERAHLLDDLDLLVAGGLEDDVELVLLLGGSLAGRTRGREPARRDRDGGGGGDVEGVLELLHEVAELEEGHLLERVEQRVG